MDGGEAVTRFTAEELARLLARPVRQLLTAADRRQFQGRRVLITGAGGSIGSELARQIARCRPARLTLLDHSEYNLFQIERELAAEAPDVPLDPVLADVSRAAFVRQAFRHARPDVAYHAAAYKHVTMTERASCAAAAVNIVGAWHVASAARDVGARLILISSDKAASPRSVMGATKRFAELVAVALAGPSFRPAVVRFGNVLGSSGSVLAILREAVRSGRPIPITDPEATRYFMTVSEAVSLVMKTDLLARAGETYWLDMGKPVRLLDLVTRLLALEAEAGFAPVPIETIGLRPGEKLREELTDQGLAMYRTSDARVWMARQPAVDAAAVDRALRQVRRAVARADAATVLQTLRETVPGFVPSGEAEAIARAQSLAFATSTAGRRATA